MTAPPVTAPVTSKPESTYSFIPSSGQQSQQQLEDGDGEGEGEMETETVSVLIILGVLLFLLCCAKASQ